MALTRVGGAIALVVGGGQGGQEQQAQEGAHRGPGHGAGGRRCGRCRHQAEVDEGEWVAMGRCAALYAPAKPAVAPGHATAPAPCPTGLSCNTGARRTCTGPTPVAAHGGGAPGHRAARRQTRRAAPRAQLPGGLRARARVAGLSTAPEFEIRGRGAPRRRAAGSDMPWQAALAGSAPSPCRLCLAPADRNAASQLC